MADLAELPVQPSEYEVEEWCDATVAVDRDPLYRGKIDFKKMLKVHEVSSFGRVRTTVKKTGAVKVWRGHHTGRRRGVLFMTGYEPKPFAAIGVHRLVLCAFGSSPPNMDDKLECDHHNRIPDDNRISNLRWVSRSENMRNTAQSMYPGGF